MRPRLGLFLVGGVIAALATREAAHAQRARREAWAEAGYTRVRQRGFAASDAGSLAARWACVADDRELAATGALLAAPDGGAIGSGALEGWGRLWRHDALRFDIGGAASTIVSTDLPSANFGAVSARGALDQRSFAAWSGVSFGALRHDAPIQPSVVVDAGVIRRAARGRAGELRLGATASGTWVRRDDLNAPVRFIVGDRYADVAGFGEWSGRGGSLALSAGVRVGELGAVGRQGYVAADAEWRVAPALAVVAGLGSQLGDPTRGAAAARFASIGLRLATPRAFSRSATPGMRPPDDAASDARVLIVHAGSAAPHLVVISARASRVEIMGDFTDWSPVPLTQVGDTWRLGVGVPSGSHRVLVRVDGGAWRVPPNLPSVDDDLGGRVGLLVVPD